jgi:hypothetical protein
VQDGSSRILTELKKTFIFRIEFPKPEIRRNES